MKIYIPEHIPCGNKGEEAIIEGIFDGMNTIAGNAEISLFSFTPEKERKAFSSYFNIISGMTFRPDSTKKYILFQKVLVLAISWLYHLVFAILYRIAPPIAFWLFRGGNWKAYTEADVILVGHDGVFSDANLFFVLFCKLIRKKTAIFGCGFKPFKTRIAEMMARLIIPRVDLVILREINCLRYLESINVEIQGIYLKPDPAFLMKKQSNGSQFEHGVLGKLLRSDSPLIGLIAVKGSIHSRFFHHKESNPHKKYQRHVAFYADIVDRVIKRTEGNILFLPHCIQETLDRDDRVIARDIIKVVKNKNRVFLIEQEMNARILKGVLSKLDFLISQRLHASIGAFGVNTPFLMMATVQDTRAHDIVEDTMDLHNAVFDLNDPDIDEFERLFNKFWKDREAIRSELRGKSRIIEKKALEAFELLSSIRDL